MKKTFFLILTLTLYCGYMVFSPIVLGDTQLVVDGYEGGLNSVASLIDKDGHVMTPLRTPAEAAGYAIYWNDEEKSVLVTRGDREIWISIYHENVRINGVEKVTLPRKPEIHENRMFVPMDLWETVFCAETKWDDSTNSVAIDFPSKKAISIKTMLFSDSYFNEKYEVFPKDGLFVDVKASDTLDLVIGFGGRYFIDNLEIVWKGRSPGVSMTLYESNEMGNQLSNPDNDIIVSDSLRMFCQFDAAYLKLELTFDEDFTGIIKDVFVFGDRIYSIELDNEEIFLDVDNTANPLSPYIRAIYVGQKLLSDRLLEGKEHLTDHQKVLVFMEYIAKMKLSATDGSTLQNMKDGLGQCGNYANALASLLSAQGIPCRLTTLGNMSGNGHATIEVYTNNRWQHYDPTYNLYYTIGEDGPSPWVLSLEDVRSGRYNGAICVKKFAEVVHTGDGINQFGTMEALKGASPAGHIGLDNPLVYPLIFDVSKYSILNREDTLSVKHQGADHVGATYINAFHEWRVKGLAPETEYVFTIEGLSVQGDVFLLRAETEGAIVEHIFSKDDLVFEIVFKADERGKAQIKLTHEYFGPEHQYVSIASYSVKVA